MAFDIDQSGNTFHIHPNTEAERAWWADTPRRVRGTRELGDFILAILEAGFTINDKGTTHGEHQTQ
jgi:hypothetical protein